MSLTSHRLKTDGFYAPLYKKGSFVIDEIVTQPYQLPQIMYVPSERNFISYVRTPKELKLSSESLKEFLTEFDNAKYAMKGTLELPVNNAEIEYDKSKDTVNVKGENYKVKLTEASSGFQSLVPLYLVSQYLSNSVKEQSDSNKESMSSEELQRFKKGVKSIWDNESLTDEQKRAALSVLSSKFNKTAFVNIVEEPEQNLFPSSQWNMLSSLLKYNNINPGNKLILTTHSPYIINYLSIAIQGKYLENKIKTAGGRKELFTELYRVIPRESLVSAEDVVVFELDESNGRIKQLNTIDGIPSDRNYLNRGLSQSNDMFDALLEIEQEL